MSALQGLPSVATVNWIRHARTAALLIGR